VFFAMGNHDSFPVDQFNLLPKDLAHYDDFEWLRTFYTKTWGTSLPPDAIKSLQQYGFYSVLLRPKLRLLALNTQWGDSNNFYLYLGEPQQGNEVIWLRQILESARIKGEKIITSGHISTGSSAPTSLNLYPVQYLDLMRNYSDVILLQLFGHTHYDQFEVQYNSKGLPSGVAFLAPSLTPLGGEHGRNPAVRVFEFDSNNNVLDYVQYYSNLTLTNINGKPTWDVLYRATSAYGIPDLSPVSMNKLYQQINSTQSVWEKFIYYYTSGVPFPCDQRCKELTICGIASADPNKAFMCSFSASLKRLVN